MNGISGNCAVAPKVPQEPLSPISVDLIATLKSTSVQVSQIKTVLFGSSPCNTETEPSINCLEEALIFARGLANDIEKDLTRIHERL